MANPNWKKGGTGETSAIATSKKTAKKEKKEYRFQLCEDHSLLKPVDKGTGQMVDNPYPPIYFVPNEGVAIDPATNERRAFRYIYGYPSVWKDEQVKPEPSKQQLLNEKNTIMFSKGFLRVQTSDKAKLQALMLSDLFEGNENKIEQIPSVYRLIDEEKAFEAVMDAADRAYEAETAVRKATATELLPLAMVFGINAENDEDDEPRIRRELILKAKSAPDALLKHLVDPRNKVKYTIRRALKDGLIISQAGNIAFGDTQAIALTGIDSEGDVSEQVASRFISKDKEATDLYERLQLTMA